MSDPNSPFALLGIAPAFDLDEAAVRRAYLAAMARVHPDHAGGGGLDDAARLNSARETLSDPERRAAALLDALGGPSAAACKDLPEGFLAEMMRTRMEIEEAGASGDPADAAAWASWAEAQRAERLARIGAAFAAAGGRPGADALREIRVLLNALRYVERLIEQLSGPSGPRP